MAKISIKNLANAIYKSTEDKSGHELDLAIENSANLIREKHLLSQTKQILLELEKIINEKRGIIKVKIISKTKITDDQLNELKDFIKKKFKAKEINIELKEDKKILGGLRLEIGENIIDTTLQNKLIKLQNYLTKN